MILEKKIVYLTAKRIASYAHCITIAGIVPRGVISDWVSHLIAMSTWLMSKSYSGFWNPFAILLLNIALLSDVVEDSNSEKGKGGLGTEATSRSFRLPRTPW